MNDQRRNNRPSQDKTTSGGVHKTRRNEEKDAVHIEPSVSTRSNLSVYNSEEGPSAYSVGLGAGGLENPELYPTSKGVNLRLIPFIKSGTCRLEVPPMYPNEQVVDKDGNKFQFTERGWMAIGGPMKKTDLDPTLGLRYNSGKVRFGLIPAHWTRALAQILTVGAQKYAPRNWEKGLVHSEVLDSLYRHLDAFLGGERYDPETKCHHLGHVAWNALALMTFDLKKVGKNDLEADGDLITQDK